MTALLAEMKQQSTASSNSAKTTINKLFMAAIGQRDYSAQELCHLIMGYSLYHASRTFVTVQLGPEVDTMQVSHAHSQM